MRSKSGSLRDVHRIIQRREDKREKETEVARRIKGGSDKGERQIQPVISSLSILYHLEHRDSQSWVEKRRGREETEATWWRKTRV